MLSDPEPGAVALALLGAALMLAGLRATLSDLDLRPAPPRPASRPGARRHRRPAGGRDAP